MKRLFDFCVSLLALIGLVPVIGCVCILVWLDLGCPVFFVQTRPGLRGHPFKIYKFRTMIKPNANGLLMERDSHRLTKIGRFLRSTSQDEIPQLLNVIKGEMSLVGPRPLLMEYLPLYNSHQMRRHDVLPGITGWAQIQGRNNLSWQEKFELDVWYVENHTFWLDLKIIFLTILKVCQREGISSPEHVTSERFDGNN